MSKNSNNEEKIAELRSEMKQIGAAHEEFDMGQRRFINNELSDLQTFYRGDAEMQRILDDLESNTQQYRKAVASAADEKLDQIQAEKKKLMRQDEEKGRG